MTSKVIASAQASLQIWGVYFQKPTSTLFNSHQVFNEQLLCAEHYSGLWEYIREQNKGKSCPQEVFILLRRDNEINKENIQSIRWYYVLFRENSGKPDRNMCIGWLAILKEVIRENVIGKVTFEHSSEGSVGVRCLDICRKKILGRKNTHAKAWWVCSRNRKKARETETEQGRKSKSRGLTWTGLWRDWPGL